MELQAVVMLKEKAKEMTRIKSDTAILNNEIDKLSEGLHQGVGNVQTLDQVQLEYDVLQKKW